MTSTADLREWVKAESRKPPDAQDSDRLSIWRIQLLSRGYEVKRGLRGGVSFVWVGHVRDDDPRWMELEGK